MAPGKAQPEGGERAERAERFPVWKPSGGSHRPNTSGVRLGKSPLLRTVGTIEPISRARYLELVDPGDAEEARKMYDRVFHSVEAEGQGADDRDSGGDGTLEELLEEELRESVEDGANDADGMHVGGDRSPPGRRGPSGSSRRRAVVADSMSKRATRKHRVPSARTELAEKGAEKRPNVVVQDVLDASSRRMVTRSRATATASATTASTTTASATTANVVAKVVDRARAAPREAPFIFTSTMTEDMKRDDALYLVLAELKYESWSHLVETLVRRAGGHGALAEKNEKRDRETKLEIKGGNIVLDDVLKRNGLLHDDKFARAYRAASKGLQEHLRVVDGAIALERHSKLTNEWSSLTPEEHSWYLTHQHRKLVGQDAKLLATLAKRVEREQQAYRREIHRAYEEDHQRFKFGHLTDRQAGQLENDDRRRQARVRSLFPSPVPLALAESIPRSTAGSNLDEVAKLDIASERSAFKFVTVLHTIGEADELSELAPDHDLQGHKHYMPPIGPPSSTVFTKPEAVEIDEDPVVTELLRGLSPYRPESAPATTLVTTASAFHKLIANDSMSQAMVDTAATLDIPITWDGSTWYLHKPCLPRKLMAREKQRRLQKYAALSESCRLPREQRKRTIYALWRHAATGILVIVRHRSVFRMAETPVLFGVKPEYLPAPDREQQTPEETATWTARLSLGAPLGARTMQLAHVNIATGRILSWEAYQGPGESSIKRDGVYAVTCPSLAGFLSWIDSSPPPSPQATPSRYASVLAGGHWDLYTHAPGPLAAATKTFDVRTTLQYTATDVLTKPFVPPIWRRYNDDMAQIPDTFPPRRQAPKQAHIIVPAHRADPGPSSERMNKKRRAKKRGAGMVVSVPDDLDGAHGIPAPTCELKYEDDL